MVNQGDISVWTSATNQITLSQTDVLGSGGEGAVYELRSNPDLVAKIYHSNRRTDAIINKLDVMINYPPRTEDDLTGHLFVAWPSHLVYDTASEVIGFLMPKVEKTNSLFEYYNPSLRRRSAPHVNYANLCSVAKSLATALDRLHGSGYVVGDINESNAYITENEHVTLIDTDSFQITDYQTTPPTIYRSLVGKPEYTPPELQGVSFAQVDRNIHHDRFALAVVIYQLLMEGTHPFRGIYTGPGEKPLVESCISQGYFLHSTSRTVPLSPVPSAVEWNTLHEDIRALFRKCFDDGHADPQARPAPRDWIDALDEAMRTLKQCPLNASHWEFDKQASPLGSAPCAWCERKANIGIESFPNHPAQSFVPPQSPPQTQPPPPPSPSPSPQQSQTTQPPQPQTPQPQTHSSNIRRWISAILSMIHDSVLSFFKLLFRGPGQIWKISGAVVICFVMVWLASGFFYFVCSTLVFIIGVARIDRESRFISQFAAHGFRKPPPWINTPQSRNSISRLLWGSFLAIVGGTIAISIAGGAIFGWFLQSVPPFSSAPPPSVSAPEPSVLCRLGWLLSCPPTPLPAAPAIALMPTSSPTPASASTPAMVATSTPVPPDTPIPAAIVPTNTPIPINTSTHTPAPTDTPTPRPTFTPSPTFTATHTPTPTITHTPSPTNTPTPLPSLTPTPFPTSTHTPLPTSTPSPSPCLYFGPGVDLNRCDLSDKDFRGFDFSGANLAYANLTGANFKDAVLTNATIAGASVEGINLTNVNLSTTDISDIQSFNKAILVKAVFPPNADLAEATFVDADLSRSSLVGANLKRSDFTRASLYRAILNQAVLMDANLRRANLEGAFLNGTNLQRANLAAADFSEIYFDINPDFRGADLRNANFYKAVLNGVDFSDARLDEAKFNRTELNGAMFVNANLNEAEMKDAIAQEARFNNADVSDANFSDSSLTNANFQNADVEDAKFTEADLKGANFSGAINADNAIFKETVCSDGIVSDNCHLEGRLHGIRP